MGLCDPCCDLTVARARLVMQLLHKAPSTVGELFDAAWNRAPPWAQLLSDACGQVLLMVPRPPGSAPRVSTILCLQSLHRPVTVACRFLSRWGTSHAAFADLWQDVVLPRTKKVLGVGGTFVCAMCQSQHPSQHALAAHVHRKHSADCRTRYTNGTVCLWCHTDMRSTDRLKYHLRTTRHCLHGLRVTVGLAYEYGSGTKRGGRRGHVGLPSSRLPGPLNATPAQ